MEIRLLGTGAAAGWPNPFCTCASCAAAGADGEIRAHTSALVDEVLLLDLGQDVPRSAARLGVRLDRVRHLFLTHAHHDHADGAALLARHWAGSGRPLDVVGPPQTLVELARWLPPSGSGVTFRPIRAGDVVEYDEYRVRALAADHDTDGALLYDVTDAAGNRLLYATDTGPGFTTSPGTRYDVVLLEETWGERPPPDRSGHHDLAAFAQTLARLRRARAIDSRTRVVAVHLGHGNPRPSLLRAQLAAWAAEVLPDGAMIRTGEPATRPRRPRRTLVLGGARSGKSATAERMLAAEPAVRYVATSTAASAEGDPEWRARVAAHRACRPASWTTTETADLAQLLRVTGPDDPPLLIDCLTVWLSGVLERAGVWVQTPHACADTAVAAAVDDLVDAWTTSAARVVAVSNEVGAGVVPAYPSGRRFRDELGSLNARLAATADDVLFVTAGIARSLLPSPPSESP